VTRVQVCVRGHGEGVPGVRMCQNQQHLRQLVLMCGRNSSRVNNFLFHVMIFLESTVLFVSFHVFLSRLDGDGRAMVE
jgi:hypothetical protein